MFPYLCTRQGSLSLFTIFGVTLDVEIFHCPQGCLKESNPFLRFKTGAITRQGVWPSSQYWIALIYLAHCYFLFGIWNGFLVLLFWRFKTGAFTRQGVCPSSQYLIALIHSAHCIFIWRQEWGLCNTIWRLIGWITAVNSKRSGMSYILSFKQKNLVASWI